MLRIYGKYIRTGCNIYEVIPLVSTFGKIGTRVLASALLSLILLAPLFVPSLRAQNNFFSGAPETAKASKNPYAENPAAVKAGESLYGENCAFCHGYKGDGRGGNPAVNSGPAQAATEGQLFWYLTKGDPARGMPSSADLTERERWEVVSYLRSLRGNATPATATSAGFDAPPVASTVASPADSRDEQGNSFRGAPQQSKQWKNPFAGNSVALQAGATLYAANCAKCHGSKGQGDGVKVPPLASGPPQWATDGEIFWFVAKGDPAAGMPAWPKLSEEERWKIVTYVRTILSGDVK